MSSSFDKSQKKLKRKRKSNFCSTPVVTEGNRLSSISISAVDTNSSSSAKTVNKDIIRRTIETKKKTRRKKQRRKTKRKSKKDSDSDWETKWEQSVYDETLHSSNKKAVSDSDDVLFMDVKSPEHVRDAPRLLDDRLESPTLRFNQWQIESPRKITFAENKDTLPLKELPFLISPVDDSDEEEQPLFLKRDNAVRTYLRVRNPRHSKKHVSIEKCKQWLIDVRVPTTSSDLLWDNFVQNNCTNISKYLATPPNYENISSHQGKSGETGKDEDIDLNAVTNEGEKNWKDFQLRLHKDMNVVHGHWDKSLGKWSRTYDDYCFPAQEDVEFGGNSGTAQRMTLNQFLHKCKAEKGKVKENSSPLRSPRNVENDSNGTRNKRRLECFEFKSKRSRTMAADISDSELQRINELRKFASRLNAKEKSFPNEMSLDETTTTSRLSKLKRVKKHENVTRRQRITAKNKPAIRTVEVLSTVRYNKETQAWEHI
nr:PREDICTED: uncharacterized protein LOC100883621 [Megachile rotundata]